MADPDTETQAFPGSQDLAALQTFVQQQEQIFGPLKSLASANGNNIVTWTIGTSPDAGHLAQLSAYTGAAPPPKAGFTIVCSGTCLVSNAVQQVAAYRKTP
jgi:hypothetical protein